MKQTLTPHNGNILAYLPQETRLKIILTFDRYVFRPANPLHLINEIPYS
jgi:hypothetical protein